MGIIKLAGFIGTLAFTIGIICILGLITFAMAKGLKELLVYHNVKYPYLYTVLIMIGIALFIPCIPFILYGFLWLSIIAVALLVIYGIVSAIIDFMNRNK